MSLPEVKPKQTINVGKEVLQEDTDEMSVKVGEKRKLDEDTSSPVQTKRLKGNGCANGKFIFNRVRKAHI
jgi:E3 ubiquitin-protein ligase UBR7